MAGPRSATAHPGIGGHWVQVSSHPPTWYPRGVPADCPTDCHSGEWVSTRDERGTRLFIPFKGIPGGQRQGLVQEALALRTAKERRRIAEEDSIKPGTAALAVAALPIGIPIMAGVWLVAPWWFFQDHWKDGHP